MDTYWESLPHCVVLSIYSNSTQKPMTDKFFIGSNDGQNQNSWLKAFERFQSRFWTLTQSQTRATTSGRFRAGCPNNLLAIAQASPTTDISLRFRKLLSPKWTISWSSTLKSHYLILTLSSPNRSAARTSIDVLFTRQIGTAALFLSDTLLGYFSVHNSSRQSTHLNHNQHHYPTFSIEFLTILIER